MVFSVTSDLEAERLARIALDAAFRLHSELGPGLLESVYETPLAARREQQGIKVDRQKPIDITFDGVTYRGAFVADLLLDGRLLIELKSVERTAPSAHQAGPYIFAAARPSAGIAPQLRRCNPSRRRSARRQST